MLESYERAGHQDPSEAWDAFTRTWNWAAPLGAALPVTSGGLAPVVRSAPGGFSLSGRWRLPCGEPLGWLAVPVEADRSRGETGAGERAPDLFVIPAKVFPRARHGGDGERRAPLVFDLADEYVPAGLATHVAGTALGAQDAVFLRTAVTAMALGAARRLTEALAGAVPGTGRGADPSATPLTAPAVELGAVLHDERTALAAALRGTPGGAEPAVRPLPEEPSATHLARIGPVVRHVIVAAYERALPDAGRPHGDRLVRMVEDASPILQCMRYAVEAPSTLQRDPTRKAPYGDERRISG